MTIKLALAGNPNCGKTTLFNRLTGSTQRVGNWPGVTIDKKTGKMKGADDIEVIDTPGIYSLSPYSPEENVTRDFLLDERPDVVINIVDVVFMDLQLALLDKRIDVLRMMQNLNAFKMILLFENLVANRAGKH